jgi:hypothetical protein
VSEYQYYEFAAVDRPLDGRQLDELRALSTRADITSTSFVNSYQWGSFRGDPRVMMEKYFDGFLYLANWGTHELMLRLPARLLDLDEARNFCLVESVSCWASRGNVVLAAVSEDENGDFYDEGGEGALGPILPVRAEVMSGDLRALYLLWLVGVQTEQLDGDELEPPVPAGLGALSGSQTALAEFLRVDRDLIAAAAEGSEAALPPGPDIDAWVASLAAHERDALLIKLLRGDDPHLRALTLRRAGASSSGERRRTVNELLSAAEIRRNARLAAERARREVAAAERERALAAARERRVTALRAEGEGVWRRIAALVATKKPAEYDRTVDLLVDLRDACPEKEFRRRISELRDEHRRKPSLLDRLDRAGL